MAGTESTPAKIQSISLQQEGVLEADATIFSPGIATPGHSIQSLFKDISNTEEECAAPSSRLGGKQQDSAEQDAKKATPQESAESPAAVPRRGCMKLLSGRGKTNK